MNKVCKEKLQKAVDVLKQLHFKEENIMVTGSIALDMYGLLPTGRIIHDVDLIIKMDDQVWRCMKLLEAINNADQEENIENLHKEEYPMSSDKMITLKSDNLVINIWKYDKEWSDIRDINTGVYVATADHVLNAKKGYSRPKDIKDISDICKKILI